MKNIKEIDKITITGQSDDILEGMKLQADLEIPMAQALDIVCRVSELARHYQTNVTSGYKTYQVKIRLIDLPVAIRVIVAWKSIIATSLNLQELDKVSVYNDGTVYVSGKAR